MTKFFGRIAISLFIFALIYFISLYISTPVGHSLRGKWQFLNGEKSKYIEVPFEVMIKHPQVFTVVTKFPAKWGDTLVLPEVNGGGFEVYLNGKKIYQVGNIKDRVENIWNRVFFIPMFSSLKPGENTLRIKLFAFYNAGLTITPYIGKYPQIEKKIIITEFLKHDTILIIMGIAIALAVILLSLTFIMKKGNRKRYFTIGMSSLLFAIYLLDLQHWYVNNISTYIWIRKILIISLYLAVFFFLAGLENNNGRSKRLKIFFAGTILTSLFVFAQPTALQYKFSLSVGALFVAVMIVFSVLKVYLDENYELILPITLTMEITIYVVILILEEKPNAFLVSYGALSLIAGIGIFLIKDYVRNYSNMVVLHKAAMTDPLTGMFNRQVLKNLELSQHDVIAMIDMDGFKKVNDRYGHEKGDELLKTFCEKSTELLRNQDFVIRYGGDEFLFVLRNCNKKEAISILERVRKSFEKESIQYGVTFSYGIERVGKNLEETIKKADLKMYHAKSSKKHSN